MTVVDASVAVKWFLPEAGSDEARHFQRTNTRLLAPSIARVEVTSGLLRAYRENRITETRARQLCSAWDGMLAAGIIELLPNEELLAAAIDISIQVKHHVVDCLYLAAAKRRGVSVITADRPFYLRSEGFETKVTLLSGIGPN